MAGEMDKSTQWVDREFRPIAGGRAMHTPIDALDNEELVTAYAMLDFVGKKIEKRTETIKAKLKEEAESKGEVYEKGKKMRVEGSVVTREERVSKSPDEAKLRALLEAKGIPIEEAFTEQKAMLLDASKVEFLISTGKLTQQEVDDLKGKTYACKVKPSTELEDLLEEAAKQYEWTAMQFGAKPQLEEKKPAKKSKKASK